MIDTTLSLVMPMFNEEANIEHAIRYAVEALEEHVLDYEIIIVDDASTDNSPEVVRRAIAGNPKIKMIRHEFNQKLGATLRTGFGAARMDLILYMDADLPFDPSVLGRAIRAMNVTRADVISGYRFDRTTEGLKRAVYSIAYNALIRNLFNVRVRDVNFSFKLMKREVLEAITLRSDGSLIDAELIVKALNHGFVVQQIGLDYFPRVHGESSLSSPGVILKILRELVSLSGDMRRRVPRPAAPQRAASSAAQEHANA